MFLLRHFVVASMLVLALGSVAEARINRAVRQPASPSPSDQMPPVAAASPAPAASCAPVCNPCPPKMEVVLQVKDPCTCCIVEVPVCIPTCCTGNPSVCCYRGFLGRQVVEYSWGCGVTVKVIFNRHGCYVVKYCGC